jgi:hypothetical protein
MVVRSATREIRLFFGIQFQNQRVHLRASYFASRVGAKCDFPGEFVGCSVPVLSAQKPWFPQGFSHIGIIALAFCAHPCMSMPAGAAPVEIVVSCAVLDPKSISVSRLVSRQSRARTLVFRYKMINLKQLITPQNSCSAHECFVLFN